MDKYTNISLVGHTGVGKTTLGIELSKNLNKNFYDLDIEIEKDCKMNINEIFDKYGEKYFRKYEENIINKFIKKKNFILSTGAGAILSKKNRNILKKISLIIYLKCNINLIIYKILKFKDRPLINKNKKNKLIELFKKREILYENISDIKIETKKKNIQEIIKDIINIINIKYKKLK